MDPSMKRCRYCAEDISADAVVCPYCRSDQTVDPPVPEVPAAPPAPAGPRIGEGAIRFSHSGDRYILGFGTDFFGIWDRTTPGGPVLTFPRTNDGWNQAWNHYLAWEPRAVEVPHASAAAPDLAASVRSYRSARPLRRWVIGLLGLAMLLYALELVFLVSRIDALRQVEVGARTFDEIEASAVRLNAVAVIELLALVASGVVWLIWQHRSQANLRALGAGNLRFSPGWAVGWWFIPVMNVVYPYLTMRELMKASDPASGAADWAATRTPAILGLWWASWLARLILGGVRAALGGRFLTASQLAQRDTVWLVANVVSIAAAILAILVVREVDRRQSAKFARVTEYTSTLVGTPVSSFGA
jgi:hypothetical protein